MKRRMPVQKLYNCHRNYVGPIEKGQHVTYYIDLGYVLADNEQDAIERMTPYADLNDNYAVQAFLVRRSPKAEARLGAELQKQQLDKRRLQRSVTDLKRWINSCQKTTP